MAVLFCACTATLCEMNRDVSFDAVSVQLFGLHQTFRDSFYSSLNVPNQMSYVWKEAHMENVIQRASFGVSGISASKTSRRGSPDTGVGYHCVFIFSNMTHLWVSEWVGELQSICVCFDCTQVLASTYISHTEKCRWATKMFYCIWSTGTRWL